MSPLAPTYKQLIEQAFDLRLRLNEATETLEAIRNGEVDAVLGSGPQGDQLFTLKGADEPYRVIIEEMNQGAVTLSADGSILYCNRRFAKLLKKPLEEIVGCSFDGFVAAPEHAGFAALLDAARAGGCAGEITLRAGDGSAVPLQLALGPLPEASVATICLVATDISESREKEARLCETMDALVQAEHEAEAARVEAERANAAKSEFLANMSHEIRTPMNGIIGMTDLVLETGLQNDQREYLGMVKTSAHSLLGLINDILDFSKIEAGKLELESIDFSLHHCLNGLLKPLGVRARQKGLELLSDISADAPKYLVGDPMRLRQVLINLTDNAIKFTPRGKVAVAVAAEATGDGRILLHFSVADTGIGIPMEKQHAIFGAFAQADGSTTRTHGGTGLGLAIASQIVGLMDGKIWIESTPGRGTTFHFTARFTAGDASRVPASPGPASNYLEASLPKSGRREADADGLRILLAEDNAINRALAAGILEKRGHFLVHASNGREAVEATARETFDVVFMDVQMPEMDGFEATQRIRESDRMTGRHTLIVAMTAHALNGDRDRCLAAGMDDYLSKPLQKAALLALLEKASAGRPRRVSPVRPAARSELPPSDPERHPTSQPDPGNCLRIAWACGLFTLVLGLAVLLGWALDFRPLMTVLPGLVTMKPMTAVALFMAGLSLLLFTRSREAAGRRPLNFSTVCAGAVAALGMVVLGEYASGRDFSIDGLVFHDHVLSAAPGRMAPITAFNCVGVGIALLLLRFPKKAAWTHALAGGVAFVSFLAIIGYFYGVPSLYQSGHFTAVALHTAFGFLVLCLGLWCATSHYGFMLVVTAEGTSGMLVRRYGLAVPVLPFLFDALELPGERHGWFSAEFGSALFGVVIATTLGVLVWFGAKSLLAAERKEALVRGKLRQAHDELEQRVIQRTSELAEANAGLQVQIRERARVEHANEQIMDHSLDVICSIDAEGRFLQVSRACEALWGYPPEELIGMAYLDFVHPDDRSATIEVATSITSGQPASDFENRYLRRDGSVVPIVWTARWSPEHRIMFCVARDITARKQLEDEMLRAKEAAEASNRSKSEFLANMSHEIRTPMNGIMGMTDLVLDTTIEPEQREYLGMVKSSADSLLSLINDILDFSKIEAGKLELEAISFSLRDCLGTLLKPLGVRADQKGLELTADIRPEVPDHLIGDPMRLRQILLNLTDNAIKFTKHGDVMLQVAVESATVGEHCLHFSVTDTGIGIPAGKQALIFEAFSQADGTTTRTHGGTGLGLTIATQLVRQMGGRIWVESTVGQGTTFHFTARLPVRGTPAPSVRQADPRRLQGLPVLVVDDNAINRRILSEMLAGWRMQPVVVASGPDALDEMLRAARVGTPFPLVILDGMMPEMSGFTVAEKIREHAELSGATVMMLSSAMPSGAAARCAEVGVTSYLTKPVSHSELLDAILVAVGEAAEPEVVKNPLPAAPAASLRILLAEDNVVNRALAVGILEKRGHTLFHAANGREAVDAAAHETFDLILMDVQMPEMNGIHATRNIRQMEHGRRGGHVPIVAMTAHAMAGDRERCLAAGMDDYLSKPLQKTELLAVVETISNGGVLAAAPASAPSSNGMQPPAAPQFSLLDPLRVSSPIFSRETLLDRLDGDEALLQHMAALFRANAPDLLDDLRASLVRGSAPDLARAAHTLLGPLGAFGATHATRLTRRLEGHAEREELGEAAETLDALEDEIVAIHAALAAFAAPAQARKLPEMLPG